MLGAIAIGDLDFPRFLVFFQEVMLIVLYSVAAGKAHYRRVVTTQTVLRNMFLGVILISLGVILQAVGVSLAIAYFWEEPTSLRLLIWQMSIAGFFLGGHFLVRYNYRAFEEVFDPQGRDRRDD